MKRLFYLTLAIAAIFTGCSTPQNRIVALHTTMGDIRIELSNLTPQHRDNFLKLVKEEFYEGTLFHRVIRDFMIQAGDPESKTADSLTHLGAGGVGYTIPAEIVFPKLYHKRGVPVSYTHLTLPTILLV